MPGTRRTVPCSLRTLYRAHSAWLVSGCSLIHNRYPYQVIQTTVIVQFSLIPASVASPRGSSSGLGGSHSWLLSKNRYCFSQPVRVSSHSGVRVFVVHKHPILGWMLITSSEFHSVTVVHVYCRNVFILCTGLFDCTSGIDKVPRNYARICLCASIRGYFGW
jgi:hypothetical protein